MTAIVLNDTTAALPQVGTDLGNFIANFTNAIIPTLFNIVIVVGVLGIIGAMIGIPIAMVVVIKRSVSGKKYV